jgi:subtilisin-like proprotein convertase family protein
LSTSVDVKNDLGGNKFDKSTGTSFATQIVSACVALMLEANPVLTLRNVQAIIAASARFINDSSTTWGYNAARNWNGAGMHVSHDYGFGHIDVRAAVRLAESWLLNLPSNDVKICEASTGTLNLTAPCSATFYFRYSSSFFNSPNLRIEHVEVDVEIAFARFGDVSIVLVSPSKTQSVLLDRPGKVPPGFRDHVSTDLGDMRAGELKYTFMSTRHRGEKSHGEWKLIVSDATANTTLVKLIRWSLRVFGEELSADNTYIYTDEYLDQVEQLATNHVGRLGEW